MTALVTKRVIGQYSRQTLQRTGAPRPPQRIARSLSDLCTMRLLVAPPRSSQRRLTEELSGRKHTSAKKELVDRTEQKKISDMTQSKLQVKIKK